VVMAVVCVVRTVPVLIVPVHAGTQAKESAQPAKDVLVVQIATADRTVPVLVVQVHVELRVMGNAQPVTDALVALIASVVPIVNVAGAQEYQFPPSRSKVSL